MADILFRARAYAEEKHRGQTYDGGPFVRNHLDRVVATAVRFGETSPDMLSACWLHDVLEDTDATEDELFEEFGHEVTYLVRMMTKLKGYPGNRRERNQQYFRQIRFGGSSVVRLKLYDRITNVEASLHVDGKSYFGMYRNEQYLFAAECRRAESERSLEPLWQHLDRLFSQAWVVG